MAVINVDGDNPSVDPRVWETIQEGIDAAASGDTIIVSPATTVYAGGNNVPAGKRNLTIMGDPSGPRPIIGNWINTWAYFWGIQTSAPFTTYKHLQINSQQGWCDGFDVYAADCVIDDCVFLDTLGWGYGTYTALAHRLEIKNCNYTAGLVGVWFAGSSDMHIHHNIMKTAYAGGLVIFPYLTDSSGGVIENNTFDTTALSGFNGAFRGIINLHSNVLIRGNKFKGRYINMGLGTGCGLDLAGAQDCILSENDYREGIFEVSNVSLRAESAGGQFPADKSADNNTFVGNEYNSLDLALSNGPDAGILVLDCSTNTFSRENFNGYYPGKNDPRNIPCIRLNQNSHENRIVVLRNGYTVPATAVCEQVYDYQWETSDPPVSDNKAPPRRACTHMNAEIVSSYELALAARVPATITLDQRHIDLLPE